VLFAFQRKRQKQINRKEQFHVTQETGRAGDRAPVSTPLTATACAPWSIAPNQSRQSAPVKTSNRCTATRKAMVTALPLCRVKLRRQDSAERDERQRVVDEYLAALGDYGSIPLGSAAMPAPMAG
jgi:ribosomal protein S14